MLIQTRLLLGGLVACGGALIPLLSVQAQDAVTSQAYTQMNQVQQELNSGLINRAQANDLMSRYNDVIVKDQKWSMQDGGRLNLPDRLDLQGKLKSDNKRMANDLQNNGAQSTATGILPGLYRPISTVPYGSALSTVPYGSALSTVPYASTLSPVPYGAGMITPTPYAVGAAPVTPVQYNMYSAAPGGYTNSGYYNNSPYNSGIYNNGTGVVQGLLNRWRGF